MGPDTYSSAGLLSNPESNRLRLALIHVFRMLAANLAVMAVIPAPVARADENPAVLEIRVIEGEGAIYGLGSRATRGIMVQVTDETGKPVEGATVSFTLPPDGPGGAFATGAKTEIATTRSNGQAAVWGMIWNRTAGQFEIRITAVKGPARAGTVCAQYLSATAPRMAGGSGKTAHLGFGHKWIWISLAVAGGAAAATAGVASRKSSSPINTTGGVTIGAPSISLGQP